MQVAQPDARTREVRKINRIEYQPQTPIFTELETACLSIS